MCKVRYGYPRVVTAQEEELGRRLKSLFLLDIKNAQPESEPSIIDVESRAVGEEPQWNS